MPEKQTSLYNTAESIARANSLIERNVTYPKSFSLRYLFYRLARPLLKLNYKTFKLRHPVSPWTTQASIKVFEKILHKNMVGFEYGSGNSTLFFTQRLNHLTSLEHDPTWYSLISEKLKKHALKNIDYHLIERDSAGIREPATFFRDYGLKEDEFAVLYHYQNYFEFIKRYPDAHFDFIFIDGRARVECALNSIPKLKSGGILVLDNSDRKRYEPIHKVLLSWKKVTTTTGLFDTTIWFKP